MSYCLPSDLEAIISPKKIKKMFGVTGAGQYPTDKVQTIIDGAERMMNAQLGAIYILPVTGAQSLEIVRGISMGLSGEALYRKGVEEETLRVYGADGELPEHIRVQADTARSLLITYCGIGKEPPSALLPDAPRHIGISVDSPCAVNLAGT